MGKIKNIKNMFFGELLVVSFSHINKHHKAVWKCKCSCGNIKYIQSCDLISGKVISCGCMKKKKTIEHSTTHNKSHTRLYRIYHNMISRCYNKNNPNYKRYGGRGIIVCDDWKKDFLSFYNWSIKSNYSFDLTLDRINNNGIYEPNNCRWITQKEQSTNRCDNILITYKNETKCLKKWCEELNIPYNRIYYRLYRNCPINDLFKPSKRKHEL